MLQKQSHTFQVNINVVRVKSTLEYLSFLVTLDVPVMFCFVFLLTNKKAILAISLKKKSA